MHKIKVKRAAGAWSLACILGLLALYPALGRLYAEHRNAQALARVQASLAGRSVVLDSTLSLRVQRLNGLLASWETIGGCGAGTSTGSGGGIKWIGRSASGGLFQLQSLATYQHLSNGYVAGLNTQVTRDLSEKWNFGFSVPFLYKYYRDYLGRPYDVSNGGLGDVSALLTRRFGEVNATSLTLYVGFPTGTYQAEVRNDALSQEKQLGSGRVSGGLILDHTIDEIWGVVVLGGTAGTRGGQNSRGNYRAPAASLYSYFGYFLGPWVPSLGLSALRYLGTDRDRGIDQQVHLMSVSGTAELEWSTDSVAVLAAVSLPFGWEVSGAAADGATNTLKPGFEPWSLGLGVTLSPF